MQQSSNLKKVRSALKLTQAEIAGVLGITRKEYAAIEKKTPNEKFRDILSSSIKESLVTVLDVNLKFLYEEEKEMFHNSSTFYGRRLDRILAIIEHKGVSIDVFAKGLDIDESDRQKFIADISAGRDPSEAFIAVIPVCYKDVNSKFLKTGHGKILKD